MYDELIKNLRIYANDETDEIRFEAADAIEDLEKCLATALLEYQRANNKLLMTEEYAKQKNRWIPVTERLPEEYEYVLCRTDYGMEVGYHRDEWGQDEWTTGKFGDGTIDVSHWMPLPQPPKDGES